MHGGKQQTDAATDAMEWLGREIEACRAGRKYGTVVVEITFREGCPISWANSVRQTHATGKKE